MPSGTLGTLTIADYWWTMTREGGPYDSYSPYGVCVDNSGYVYNSDDNDCKIHKVNPTTHSLVSTISITGVKNTRGIVWIDGYLYVNIGLGSKIAKVDPSTGEIVGYVFEGVYDFSCALGRMPWGNTYHLLIGSTGEQTIGRFDTGGSLYKSYTLQQWTRIDGLAYDGEYFWISDSNAKKIYKVDTSGNRIETWDSPNSCNPNGLGYSNGYLWTTAWGLYKVWKLGIGVAPPTICPWIDTMGVHKLTVTHALYVYALSIGATGTADRKYNELDPKPEELPIGVASWGNALGIYAYSQGAYETGNRKAGCSYA